MGRTLLLEWLSAISMATEGSMSDELLHEIQKLQAEVTRLEIAMNDFAITTRFLGDSLSALHQEVRLTLKEVKRCGSATTTGMNLSPSAG
jgi:phage host-nuclease inhibitor protein Gam